MNKNHFALTILATLALTACGGGHDDDNSADTGTTTPAPVVTTPAPTPTPTPPVTTTPTPTTTASAEGVYEGSASNGLTHLSLVQADGTIYSMFGTITGGAFGISRFLTGTGTNNHGAFASTDVREYGTGASATPYTLNGTYVAGTSLNGTLSNGAGNTTFTGTALANSTYSYNTAANLANVTGAWNLTGLDGAKVALTIGADGKFTGTSGTCAVTGSLSPKTTGKNVFTFSVTYGAAPCPRPGDVTTGIAVEFSINSTRQLIAAGTDTSRVYGIGLVGAR